VPPSIDDVLRPEADAWRARGLWRDLEEPSGRDFTSNDYLALARHPEVVAGAAAALQVFGAGAPASRLLRGHNEAHRAVETLAASWLGVEAALLAPTGWQANLAVITTLAGRGDVIVSDRLNHASLIDAMRLSRARVLVYEHDDPADLERVLDGCRGARRRFIVTESVFSMEGDHAPLRLYDDIAERHDAWMIVDEAHGTGVYGPEGRGLCAEVAPLGRLAARVVTGGKALGVAGGIIAGSRALVSAVVNRGRAFVFTTAASPAVAGALSAAIEVCRREPWRAERAHAAAARLRVRLGEAGVAAAGQGPIVPLIVGEADRAMRAAEAVRSAGFDVRAVRPPTVPDGTSRLRVVCHADHADEEIDALARALVAGLDAAGRVSHSARESTARTAATLVVVGTDTGVGKTVVSALLVRAALRRDRPVRYLKLVQTGTDSDTETVAGLSGLPATLALPPCVSLPRPASIDQAAAAAGCRVDAAQLVAHSLEQLARFPESIFVLECAGGLLVPLNDAEDQGDFLSRLGAPLVLVARSGLGTLNHTLLTLEAVRSRRLSIRGLVLVGEPHADNVRSLRARLGATPIVEVPRFETLDAATLDRWLDACAFDELLDGGLG